MKTSYLRKLRRWILDMWSWIVTSFAARKCRLDSPDDQLHECGEEKPGDVEEVIPISDAVLAAVDESAPPKVSATVDEPAPPAPPESPDEDRPQLLTTSTTRSRPPVKRTQQSRRPETTGKRKIPKGKAAHISAAVQLSSAVSFLEDETHAERKPRKSRPSKSAVGEMMERALLDSSFFPLAKNWPVLDLCLYGADMDSDDDDEDTVSHVKLFPTNKWVNDLARPLNFHVLKTGEGWQTAYAMGIAQQPKSYLRGKALRFVPFEKAEIGTRIRHHDFKDQKLAQPHERGINFNSLEAFKMRVFGDPKYYSRHGAYTMHLAISSSDAFVLADSGVVHMLDRCPDEIGVVSHSEVARRRVQLNCGMQMMAEANWRVVLQYEEDRPRVAFMANQEIVKELLALRRCSDKVKKKRMIHIVSSHTRRVKDERITRVMKHYRGSTETLWNGCVMRIVPPITETDLMEKMTAKVAEIRALTDAIQPPHVVA